LAFDALAFDASAFDALAGVNSIAAATRNMQAVDARASFNIDGLPKARRRR
jgi:hypothetical protein